MGKVYLPWAGRLQTGYRKYPKTIIAEAVTGRDICILDFRRSFLQGTGSRDSETLRKIDAYLSQA